jgi:outer membrane immunogenic protein
VTLLEAKSFQSDDSVTSTSILLLAWLELRNLGKLVWWSCHPNGASSLTSPLFRTLATVLALTAVASAADTRAPIKAPPSSQTCTVNWFQGWYVGLNFGAGGYTASRTDQDGQLINVVNGQVINVTTYTQRQSGIFGGGGQFGYNWTTCNGLFGFEVDGSHGSIVVSTAVLPNSPNADVSITSRFNDLVTARVRTGIVVDNVLLYVTGGVATVHTLTTYLNLVGDQFTFSDWRTGWVAGIGAELAITSNISARSDVLYVGAGDRTFTFVSPTLGPGNYAHSDSMWLARVGLNVKLGFDPAIPTY